MKHPGRWLLGATAALVAIAGVGAWWFRPAPAPMPMAARVEPRAEIPEPRYDIRRTIRYSFTLQNTTDRVLEHAQFWTYAPVQQTAAQACCTRLQASEPYALQTDTLGNQALHFRLSPLPPFAHRVIRITAELRLASAPNRLPQSDQQRWLGAERFVETQHPLLRAKAAELARTDPATTARTLFDWVAGQVRDVGYIAQDHGALYALQQQQGDCTEHMYLFIALARANGIPARAVGGYVYAHDAILRPGDYHNWAEYYLDGVWQLADPQQRRLAERSSDYIAMRLPSGDGAGAVGQAHRFWHTGEGLNVKMN